MWCPTRSMACTPSASSTPADPHYTGRVAVPVLWDRTANHRQQRIRRIIRMFNSAFDAVGASPDFYPTPLRGEIDAINERIYDTVNNGVYNAGFATTAGAYDDAVGAVRGARRLEEQLGTQRYLSATGSPRPTGGCSPRWCASMPVYHGHFKCNLRRIVDYPNLWAYTRELYQMPGRRRDGRLRPHQAPLLRQPPDHQPDGHRADRARFSTSILRTAAARTSGAPTSRKVRPG